MTTRSTVAAWLTQPETVLQDDQRLCELAGGSRVMAMGAGSKRQPDRRKQSFDRELLR